MLTLKEAEDGLLYHAQREYDDSTEDYKEESEFILDENGDKIPAHICLCFAHEPSECCCATTSWEGYRYDDNY